MKMGRITLEAPDHILEALRRLAESMEVVSVIDDIPGAVSSTNSNEESTVNKKTDRLEAGLREALAMSRDELPKRSIQAFLDEL